jgi:uncharacterized protein YndB with AHSA1/START domain
VFVAVTAPIAASPDAVWSVLVDVERWPEWTESMRTVTKLTEGPLAVGSLVRIKQPRLPVADWEVSELDPGRSFTWRSPSTGMDSIGVHEVRPTGDGTTEIYLSFDQTGSMAAVVGFVLGRMVRRYVQMEADGLVARCTPG